MMKLGKISTLAFSRMRKQGISLDALRHLLAHGHVDVQHDGARLVYLDCPPPRPLREGRPGRMLYAVLDAAGEVLTVDRRVRIYPMCTARPDRKPLIPAHGHFGLIVGATDALCKPAIQVNPQCIHNESNVLTR